MRFRRHTKHTAKEFAANPNIIRNLAEAIFVGELQQKIQRHKNGLPLETITPKITQRINCSYLYSQFIRFVRIE